ncbi:MAG: hypothetical protein BWK73_49150 [Thiothrix lacustris]|uniref:Novel STAND NTPase 1 domain-containing protein n=1 Tax=Thiothrix lacustris TaxID=525917 RepID=A0A1Y1Q984_9GAMM|nr:MAG: hypothetical protein BWK73_49150 [Thiothrix lacustris]
MPPSLCILALKGGVLRERRIKELGYIYEEDLLNKLLIDLSNQYLISKPSINNVLFGDTIELPYLQIVCSYLWKTKKPNRETISHEDYSAAGSSQGILHNHLNISLSKLTPSEKYITDRIFSCLISYPGFKVAYTIEGLSKTINVKNNELSNILNKLEKTHIVRKNNNKNDNWYELSHDMYSQIIREWQYAWRDTPEWDISLPELRRRKIINIKYNGNRLEAMKATIKNRLRLFSSSIRGFFKKKPRKYYSHQYKNHSKSKNTNNKPSIPSFIKEYLLRLFSEEYGAYSLLWLIITIMSMTIVWIIIIQNY